MNIYKMMNSFDLFSTQVPSFTFNKEKSLGTSIGFLFSVLITTLILAFSATKLIIVIQKSQSIVTQGVFEH